MANSQLQFRAQRMLAMTASTIFVSLADLLYCFTPETLAESKNAFLEAVDTTTEQSAEIMSAVTELPDGQDILDVFHQASATKIGNRPFNILGFYLAAMFLRDIALLAEAPDDQDFRDLATSYQETIQLIYACMNLLPKLGTPEFDPEDLKARISSYSGDLGARLHAEIEMTQEMTSIVDREAIEDKLKKSFGDLL
jgi:hypothetical protein